MLEKSGICGRALDSGRLSRYYGGGRAEKIKGPGWNKIPCQIVYINRRHIWILGKETRP